MGVVQLPDELQRIVEQEVALGHATSPSEFLEHAVMRLIDDAAAEEEAIRQSVEAGLADIEVGRYSIVHSLEDQQALQKRVLGRLHARLAEEG